MLAESILEESRDGCCTKVVGVRLPDRIVTMQTWYGGAGLKKHTIYTERDMPSEFLARLEAAFRA